MQTQTQTQTQTQITYVTATYKCTQMHKYKCTNAQMHECKMQKCTNATKVAATNRQGSVKPELLYWKGDGCGLEVQQEKMGAIVWC